MSDAKKSDFVEKVEEFNKVVGDYCKENNLSGAVFGLIIREPEASIMAHALESCPYDPITAITAIKKGIVDDFFKSRLGEEHEERTD